MLVSGRITRQISNLYTVSSIEGVYGCRARGKFRNMDISPMVGDEVLFDLEKQLIEEIKPRKNYLSRPIVANIDVALLVTSVRKPALDLVLLDKLISVVTHKKIEPVILFTKVDLLEEKDLKLLKDLQNYYKCCGINTFFNTDLTELKTYLKDKVVVLTGQTGAGKSTLINRLEPNLHLKTQKISEALGRGKHTTRHTEIFDIGGIFLVDTPGFSSISINEMSKEELRDSFIEFKNYECKFKDCMHLGEETKICGVKNAVLQNYILQSRYQNYRQFMEELQK